MSPGVKRRFVLIFEAPVVEFETLRYSVFVDVLHRLGTVHLCVYLTSFLPFFFLYFLCFLTYLLPYLFTSRLIYLLLPEQTHSISRPEVIGAAQTWL